MSGPATGGPPASVCLELFAVALGEADTLCYLRRVVPLERRPPDPLVAQWLRELAALDQLPWSTPAIVHSTSWRYEAVGTVLLTYLAYGEAAAQRSSSRPAVPPHDLATLYWSALPALPETDPQRPAPPLIEQRDVLAHGLRHLALLARRPGATALRARLGPRSLAFFEAIEPALPGQLEHRTAWQHR